MGRSLPRWAQVVLGVAGGLLVYGAMTSLWSGAPAAAPPLQEDVEIHGTYFQEKYAAATRTQLLAHLEDCRTAMRMRHDQAISSLVDADAYELVRAEGGKLSIPRPDTTTVSAVQAVGVDAATGLYRKVEVPRGYDPEFDLLIEECTWLEREISQRAP